MTKRSKTAEPAAAAARRRKSNAIPANVEVVLSRADVAAALRVSDRFLDGMVAAGEYPPPDTHLGRAPRWLRETHDRWLRQRCGKEA